MVHKKYIKRGNKIFGPYLYKNYRVNGITKTKYLGRAPEEKKIKKLQVNKTKLRYSEDNKRINFSTPNENLFKIMIIVLGVIILSGLFFFSYSLLKSGLTGRVALQLSPSYAINETITGNLNLKMKKGELISSDSVIKVKLGAQEKQFLLSELVSISQEQGNFYAEEKNLEGSGSGYGFKGKKTSTPKLSFILLISEKEDKAEEEPEIVEEEPVEEEIPVVEEQPEETTTPSSQETEEPEIVEEEPVEEEIPEEEEQPEETEPEASPITGEVIAEINEISGIIKAGETLEYEIQENQKVKIKQVTINGEKINKNSVNIDVSNNIITITTDYVEEEEGFGEEFLGEEEIIIINLEDFDLKAEQGNLEIEILTNEQSLTKSSKEIVVEGVVEEKEPEEEITDENITDEGAEKSRVTPNITEIPENITEEETNVTTNITSNVSEVNISETNITEPKIIINITPEINITTNITIINETITNITIINETITNITIIENTTITTQQYQATINKPVKWNKNIKLKEKGAVKVELPKIAENITVFKSGEEIVEEEKPEKEKLEKETSQSQIINNTNQTAPPSSTENETSEPELTVEEPSEEILETEIPESEIPISEQETPESEIPISEQQETELEVNIKTKEQVKQEKISITGKIITGKITADIDLEKKPAIIRFFLKIFRTITGRAIITEEVPEKEIIEVTIDENATEYDVEYVTPGPVSYENLTERGKEIIISGPDELHYENVLAYTQLPYEMPVSAVKKIKLYWITNQSKNITQKASPIIANETPQLQQPAPIEEKPAENITNQTTSPVDNATTPESAISDNESSLNINNSQPIITSFLSLVSAQDSDISNNGGGGGVEYRYEVQFTAYDTNNNTLIDYIEWIVPELSNQTYELIIEITKAEHLDENRTFISDIYEQVKAKDNIWSEIIPPGHFVRVVFEQALDKTKDITLYVRPAESESNKTSSVIIDGKEVPYDVYEKKKRIDEIRGILGK